MKKYGLVLFAACVPFLVMPAHAEKVLTGSFVSGTLQVDGYPPLGFSSVTGFGGPAQEIGSGTEFSATTNSQDDMTDAKKPKPFTFTDTFSANFSNMLDVDNVECDASISGTACNDDPTKTFPGFTMTFVDTAFADIFFAPPEGYTEPDGFTYKQSGDTLSVTFVGGSNPVGAFKLAVSPEPQSLVLLGTGMLGVFAAARRRLSV